MATYTAINLIDAEEILNLYGKNGVLELIPLSLGISNSNYKVILKKETVLLKISNDKNEFELNEEQQILSLLHQKKYPFSLNPFVLKNGELVYRYQKYFGVLYPFIEGIPPGPADSTCFEIGKALAKLHSLNWTFDELKKVRPHEKVGFGGLELIHYKNSKECPSDFKEAFDLFFPDELKTFTQSQLAKGVIHGDLYYDNTLFDLNHLRVVLDFEQAGIGEYLLDLGISLSGCCLEKGRISKELVNSYLKGYESIKILNPLEKSLIDTAILLGLMSISLWRIKRFKERNLNPHLENSYRDLIVRGQHYFELI